MKLVLFSFFFVIFSPTIFATQVHTTYGALSGVKDNLSDIIEKKSTQH